MLKLSTGFFSAKKKTINRGQPSTVLQHGISLDLVSHVSWAIGPRFSLGGTGVPIHELPKMSGNLMNFKLEKLDLNSQQKYPTDCQAYPPSNKQLTTKNHWSEDEISFAACPIFRVFAVRFLGRVPIDEMWGFSSKMNPLKMYFLLNMRKISFAMFVCQRVVIGVSEFPLNRDDFRGSEYFPKNGKVDFGTQKITSRQ